MKNLSISRVILNLMLALFVSVALTAFVAPAFAFIIGALIFAGGFLPNKVKGSFAFALQTEVWIQDIQESVFEDSSFMLKSLNDDSYVVNKTVHLPQSGTKPGVQMNRSVLPAVAAERTDEELTYDLAEFTTDPILLRNIDELQISYDKRASIMAQNMETLKEKVSFYCTNIWSTPPAGVTNTIIQTTGSAVATALAPGATGTRLAITLTDMNNCAKKLDNDLVPRVGRIMLMPTDMFWQLFAISEIVRASYNGFNSNPSVVASGVVAEVAGFKIMLRPTVNVYDDTPALKAVGAATATTDNLGAIAWHPSYVRRALGAIDVFTDSGDNGRGKPEYYGSIMSALLMFGASVARKDGRGVVNLVQDNS